MILCKRYQVNGRVQGVFYRTSARDRAFSIGVTGWVRNTSDGGVELVACGEESQLSQLESWLHEGPAYAVVEDVQSEIITEETYSDFSIRYQ